MKLRRINPIERHAEKFVLGLFALVFVAVLSLQFVGRGNMIKVGDRPDVPVDRAFVDLAERAERQRARIRETEIDAQARVEAPNVDEEFRRALGAPVVATDRLPVALSYPSGIDADATSTRIEAIAVESPIIPGPDAPIARTFVGALDPFVVLLNPSIRDLAPTLSSEQPHDIRAVTVEAVFDASKYVEALSTDPDGDGPLQPVPQVWWQSLDLVDVELLRREVYPDGTFGAEQVVPVPPGVFSLRDRLAGQPDPRELRRAISDVARERGGDILRPRFYDLAAGEPWVPPSAASSTASAGGVEVARLKRQLDERKAELERLKSQLQQPRSLAPAGQAPVYAAGPGSGPGRSGGRDRARDARTEQDAEGRRREGIQKQIDRVQEEIKRLEEQHNAALAAAPQTGGAGINVLDEPVRRPSTGERIVVWAHDITGKAGSTYQYAIRLVLPNPLYGNDQSIDEAFRSNAASATIRTSPSPWSSDVTVDRDAYFFVTQARETAGLLGGPVRRVVTGEVFRLLYGYWRTATVELTPGDAASASTRLVGDWPIFTVELVSGAPQVVQTTNLPSDQMLDSGGWCLVDVTPTADGEGFQAVLADPEGNLTLRAPRTDRESERLAALRRNAEAAKSGAAVAPGSGATGGKPVAPRVEPPPTERREEERPATQPLDRPLGGG